MSMYGNYTANLTPQKYYIIDYENLKFIEIDGAEYSKRRKFQIDVFGQINLINGNNNNSIILIEASNAWQITKPNKF